MDTTDFYLNVIKNNKDRKEGKDAESLKRKKIEEEHYQCCHAEKTGPHMCNCINAEADRGFSNRFVQHYPNSFTVEDTDYFTLNFNTQEELMSCEFVARWKETMDNRKFHKYSISPRDHYCAASLMVEYDEGKYWWCIGYIKNTDGLTLPEWKPVYE
jgi:hypothetical protein